MLGVRAKSRLRELVIEEPILGTAVSRNGLLLIIPAMVITFGLWSSLPAAYGAEAFDRGIPSRLLAVENALRLAVLGVPVILYFGRRSKLQVIGWYVYLIGMLVYLGSYLAQIYLPASAWSGSVIGFTAPAWTTLLWFAGIALVCERTWLARPWHRWVYLAFVVAFVTAHVAHASMAFLG